MKGWKTYSVKELIHEKKILIGDGYRAKNSELSSEGIPFARAGNINNGFLFEEADRFPIQDLKRVGDKISQPFDIVFTSKGTVGRFAYVHENTERFVYSPQLCFWRPLNSSAIDSRWLYFWMHGKEFWEQVHGLKNQTDMADYVNLNDQRNMNLTLPPIREQRAIANVLSSLDDKIDLLHRQNKTLEAMAETLFRQWFVGEPRVDWESKPLSSIAVFLNGLACQKHPPVNENEKLPVLKIRELNNGVTKDSDWATSKVSEEYIVNDGDVIFSWSASLMVKLWNGPKCVLNQYLFKVSSQNFPKWFYLMWCKYHLHEFISISSSHATTMGHIKRGDLDNALVLIPSKKEIVSMDSIIAPLVGRQISNSRQISLLEKTRDVLLPQLMSGEVRVSFKFL